MTRKLCVVSLITGVLLVAGGCGASGAVTSVLPGGSEIKGKPILFVINSPPSSPRGPALSAVKAAEAMTGLKARVVYASTDNQVVAEIQTGLAAHVAGMALDVPSPAADAAICAASDGGVPVVAWNTNGYGASARRCVLAYMGQNFLRAGHSIAQYLAVRGYIKHGARVFCPVEDPTPAYAKLRAQGVNSVLASFGARCHVLGVGFGDAGNQSRMLEYLRRHPATNLVIALGGAPLANLPAVLDQLGRRIPVAGFDIADGNRARIIDGIERGSIVATIDQESYSQAFQAMMQLALYLKYGLLPSSVDTSENSVIDNTNAGLAASLAGTYR